MKLATNVNYIKTVHNGRRQMSLIEVVAELKGHYYLYLVHRKNGLGNAHVSTYFPPFEADALVPNTVNVLLLAVAYPNTAEDIFIGLNLIKSVTIGCTVRPEAVR